MSRTIPNSDIPLGPTAVRLVLITVATAVALAAIGYFPIRAQAGPRGLVGLELGLGAALVAALAGLIPPLLGLRLGPRERTNAMLAGMALRFVLMLGLLLAAMFTGWADRLVVALSAVVAYLVLLVVDTAGLSWLSKRMTRSVP